MSPVKVALVSLVGSDRAKSSAASISKAPLGRDAVAIFPSGSPVLKENDVAAAGVAAMSPRSVETARDRAPCAPTMSSSVARQKPSAIPP